MVPLNSLKLNKQQEVRPAAEERLMDMTLFPSSQKAQLQCFSTVSDSEFQETVLQNKSKNSPETKHTL